jgi:hypothetical protein
MGLSIFPDVYLYSIAFSVLSADTREAECNFIARLEHWKIIVDFSLLSGCILVLCSIIRKLFAATTDVKVHRKLL